MPPCSPPENTRILVDAGLSMLRAAQAARSDRRDRSTTIDAMLITHEHSDHVSGLPVLARSRDLRSAGLPHAPDGTRYRLGRDAPARLERFQAGSAFTVGDIEVQSFSIPHDAIDPVGFCFEAQGVSIGVATDLGYMPESIKFHLRRTNVLLLESNHDLDMLKVGPVPLVA